MKEFYDKIKYLIRQGRVLEASRTSDSYLKAVDFENISDIEEKSRIFSIASRVIVKTANLPLSSQMCQQADKLLQEA